jgi:hypothetical protein
MVVKTKSRSKKDKAAFVEAWNKALHDAKPAEERFKNRGGSKFTLTINDRHLHDIIMQECKGMGGSTKVSGHTRPQDIVDLCRSALFFMWKIPLDTPVKPELLSQFKRAIERLKKEDPDLFKTPERKKS